MKKIDLHTHTIPSVSDSSFEFDLSKIVEYVEKLELDALAITNHNTFDLSQFYQIQNALAIPVFPGVEVDLEGGHILVISDNNEFELVDFNDKCKLINDEIKTAEDEINLSRFKEIFQDLSKYLLIPHYDKKPIIKNEVVEALKPHITSGEVASFSKFKRAIKNPDGLVPVLFSDVRFHKNLSEFPTRQIFVDLDQITISGIKSCLDDIKKISLTRETGNDFFQATDEGLMLSTGLNIILGERSSGKTVTLNKIAGSSGNAKYIRQFSLLQNDEEKFNNTNKARESLIYQEYLKSFRKVVEDVSLVDQTSNHLELQNYIDSLKKFARENEKKDLYSKCILFDEDLFNIKSLDNLTSLIKSVNKLIENTEYKSVIDKHLPARSLKKLAIELMNLAIQSQTEINQKTWLNTIISDIKRDLRIKTAGAFVEEVDLYKIALDEVKISKFNEVVNNIKVSRNISNRSLGKFETIVSTNRIEKASDLGRISRDKTSFSDAYNNHYDRPYDYLNKLKEVGIEEADLYRFFIKVESKTYNRDGFEVSGGERSEFNLIHEIQDATKYDLLLIDEPESSFDNLFLKKEINSIIKDISDIMPVVVVTHNSTVGASVKPNYMAVTKKEIDNSSIEYRVYTGYPSDKILKCADGKTIANYEAMLNCLEAGIDAYTERKDKSYDILKDR